MKLHFAVVLVLFLANICLAGKILMVSHYGPYSHYMLSHVLAEELASKGHQVTLVRLHKKESSQKNLTFVELDLDFPGILYEATNIAMTPDSLFNVEILHFDYLMHAMGLKLGDVIFDSQVFKKLLRNEKHFDLVIIEQFYSDCMKYLCAHYNAPCIALSSFGASGGSNYLSANPSPSSYIPDYNLDLSAKMSFYERFYNLIYSTIRYTLNRVYYIPKHNAVIHKHFPNAPQLEDILSKVSLVFLNSHVSINQPVPHTPNMIEIGGMHMKPTKKLPNDIRQFLDGAKSGAILFSLGSNVDSKDLSLEKREAILKVFSKLKEKVLWKFDADDSTAFPPNVKVSKWLPIQDILAHPNTKLFITHGGLLSLTEAVYFAVPVVGIPIFADQPMNLAEIERIGLGVKLSYEDLNENSLTNAVKRVLGNKRYSETAKKRSAISRDRPMKPLDSAVYWVEYLLRHKTGEHLLSKEAMALPWYAFYQIDVIALLLLMAAVICIFVYGICEFIIISMLNKMKKDRKMKQQ